MTTEFKPDPVLIEAAKFARRAVESAFPTMPGCAWICDAVEQLYARREHTMADALQDAVDAVLGNNFAFLPTALYAKGIGPITDYPPKNREARTVRLWWLDQIIAGKPVPGAEN